MSRDPVLVTGGTGFVGGALLTRLVEEGRRVRALARSDAAANALASAGAEPVRGDVLDPSSLLSAMRGCAVAFHAAGVNATCQRDPRPMYRANVDGSANVVRAAAQAASPAISGPAITAVGSGMPFFLGAGLNGVRFRVPA